MDYTDCWLGFGSTEARGQHGTVMFQYKPAQPRLVREEEPADNDRENAFGVKFAWWVVREPGSGAIGNRTSGGSTREPER